MEYPYSVIWSQAPEVGIPEPPAIFSDSSSLWLAYETPDEGLHAVVRFNGVIEYQLSSVNDEGIGRHPLVKAGLSFYSFHEVFRQLHARHRYWVITFKDNALDVIASTVEVVVEQVSASSSSVALLQCVQSVAT